MAAYDDEHLYSLPYEHVPSHDISYNELNDKPSINGIEIEGAKSSEDYGIVMPVVPTKTSDLINDSGFITSAAVPTKTSQLQNDDGFITSAALPTKTSELTNDSGFITSAALPTKTSDLINDSNFTTKTYVDNEILALINKINGLDGITVVKNLVATQTFTSTFDNLATSLTTALTAIKTALLTDEFVEIKSLNIATIGNLKPLNIVTIDANTNIAALNIDWQGVSYTNNMLQAIDIVNKKVLSLTMTNDLNNDAFVSYFQDANTYTFTIYYTKYGIFDI